MSNETWQFLFNVDFDSRYQEIREIPPQYVRFSALQPATFPAEITHTKSLVSNFFFLKLLHKSPRKCKPECLLNHLRESLFTFPHHTNTSLNLKAQSECNTMHSRTHQNIHLLIKIGFLDTE